MSRTRGYYVKLWRQGRSDAETQDEPEYIMAGNEPQLFVTKTQAAEAGREYVKDKPELTYALEPVVA